MSVHVVSSAVVASAGAGPLEGFKARRRLPDRKHLKMMTRDVRLGLAALGDAVRRAGSAWTEVAPERRGLFVGGTPAASDPAELSRALQAASVDGELDVAAFGDLGVPRVPPLWLIKGLSNNIGGFGAMYHDARGVNTNRCDGRAGGLAAVLDAVRALQEGRVDVAAAGGADSLVHAAEWLGQAVGEGGAFLVLRRGTEGPCLRGSLGFEPDGPGPMAIDYGAASGVIELVRRLQADERGFEVRCVDRAGPAASIQVR